MQADGSTMTETSEFRAACAVLGVGAAPSSSEAKAAFRARAALLHPDVHQGAGAHRMDAATAAMQQLNDAYQLVLETLGAGDPPGQGFRARTRKPRSSSDRSRPGRVVLYSQRPRRKQRTEPLGRFSHVRHWHDEA